MDETAIQAMISDIRNIVDYQSSMVDEFKTVESNQSVIITDFDAINSQIKATNISIMMTILALGILVGIGFTSFLKGGKK